MPQLLLLAHAPLASALRSVAAHIFAEHLDQLTALDVPAGWSDTEVEAALRPLLPPGQVTLILTDVFGATPCNTAARLADGVTQRVVAGVNVPMLWRAMAYRNEALDTLVSRALSGGGQGVMPVSSHRPQTQSQDLSPAYAASHAHHQQ
ncbi:PTS fructose transporter subunit IIA [Ideonella sp. 4Y11]|uniref:PTS fructose transporter subunit IIA n=1 Tax=Ideonella aquatica TaxID=2824119 RepID=A0A940YH15_9BURK|nr:PTS fructose transporter subunit IIA [Ideonella aquatica]MBQ0959259.1 PTS fructose transporter subunit IIA [Ideonella aquatica]